ncbi:hypothetical protein JCM6882_002284 [Rhodosporidiobolus microsporus]
MAPTDSALRPLTLPPDFARLAQQERNAALSAQQAQEGQPSAGEMVKAITGGMGDEDWSLNERGELINEEGLPMFDIHEELPAEPIASSSSSLSAAAGQAGDDASQPKPKMRYLIKKGGRQVVRSLPDRSPLSSSTNPKSVVQPTPVPSPPSSSVAAAAAPSPPAPAPAAAADPSQPGRLSTKEIKSLLDELEAEEEIERQKADAEAEAEDPVAEDAKVEATPVAPTSAPAPAPAAPVATAAAAGSKPIPASGSAFAGFSAGFLAKGKQKCPSNSLAPPRAASSSTSAPKPAPTPAAPSPAPPTAAPLSKPLKSALSRPSSPAPSSAKRSIFDKPAAASSSANANAKEKKSVAWDMSEAESFAEERAASRAEKRAPIILGMGGEEGKEQGEVEEVKSPGVVSGVVEKPSPGTGSSQPPTPKPAPAPVDRPIKDQVVERPMKKPVAPGQAAAAGGAKKRVSRFRKAKEEMTGAAAEEPVTSAPTKEDKGKGKAREEPLPPPVGAAAPPSILQQQSQQQPHDAPAGPIHTISLSSKPTASSSSGTAAPQNGTISYADIPFNSDEDDPELDSDEDADDLWGYSDNDDGDEEDEDFDVDAALHQREVALAYHQQRMRVGAGRGTGALGGWHGEGEGVWEGVGMGGGRDEEGLVPADATLQSLTPDASLSSSTFGTYPGAGSAQLGRPSRFRQSNRHMESAQMIIPSLLAADPTLTTSHTPLGPALNAGEAGGEDAGNDSDPDGFAPAERERLRRTLAALAAGETLPEDEQKEEAEKEVRLRGEWAREKAEREKREKERRERERREGGKAPPVVGSAFKPQDPAAPPPSSLEREEPTQEPKSQEEELAELLASTSVEEPALAQQPVATAGEAEGEQPKPKLSRFRQKQLGLID